MKSILFAGAAGEVTGSGYVVTANTLQSVLVDFGMFQGTEDQIAQNYASLDFDPAALQGVFLTHAHLDHSGRLPLLMYGGFVGKIYMTEPTSLFVHVILADSARIAEKDTTRRPLYTTREVYKLLEKIEVVTYNTPIQVGDFTAIFRDAGHILGSASIELTEAETGQTILFSGDLGNTPQELVKPTQPISRADFVVMETTYGNAFHPHEDAREIIKEEVNTIEEHGGVLLIPAFALERTQELLHIFHHLKKDGKITLDTPVFLDGPMGIAATNIYYDFPDFLNTEMQSHSDDPFNFPGLTVTDEASESRNIHRVSSPKVIIAGSGMLTGGRMMQHLKNYISQATTRILFVGYQAEETLGREILTGAKQIWIENMRLPVRAHIREIKILSSHADQSKLLNWLSPIREVKKVFLTHGEEPQREAFTQIVRRNTAITDILLPRLGDEVALS